jgi:diadenosine tetraphosphatase ApaH/serine/threonine PP2A family protein phosphatase
MRYILISDIHGNLEALEAVLSFTRQLEPYTLLCLGDTVGYGADPIKCFDAITNTAELILAGNHDLATADIVSYHDFNPIAKKAIEWTKRMMSAEEIDLLGSLPLVYVDGDCYFTHASPVEPMSFNYVRTIDDAAKAFSVIGQKYCFVGHTHLPLVLRKDLKTGTIDALKEPRIETSGDYRFFVNIGSVGQPRDSNPDACIVVFDQDIEMIEFFRVPYDIATSQGKILSQGLPSYLAERLLLAR